MLKVALTLAVLTLLEEWKLSILMPIYLNKGDAQSCTNYHGIELLNHIIELTSERVIECRVRSRWKHWKTKTCTGATLRFNIYKETSLGYQWKWVPKTKILNIFSFTRKIEDDATSWKDMMAKVDGCIKGVLRQESFTKAKG